MKSRMAAKAGARRGDQVAHYLNKSDVILTVGSSLSPLRFSHAIPDAAKKTIIHCNVDERHCIPRRMR
jgi:thiamine pyrophosphate-dependent acetolactate synthase large subunit-like protein